MRSPARRHPVRKKLGWADGKWVGYVPMVVSQTNGFGYPRRFMIRQRGGWVSARWQDKERDRPNSY